MLLYAVGDIHGRMDLLAAAAEAIRANAGNAPHRVVYLGDYVDRGPSSREVVEFLMEHSRQPDVFCLLGNHEQTMVDALRDVRGRAYKRWMALGGQATLASYPDGVPEAHLEWMRNLPLHVHDGNRLYVHAGVSPGREIARQRRVDCLWIREKFLRAPAKQLPCHVVHGHTPQWNGKRNPAEPETLPHRTNLDTGACYTGVLSVGVFETEQPNGPIDILKIS